MLRRKLIKGIGKAIFNLHIHHCSDRVTSVVGTTARVGRNGERGVVREQTVTSGPWTRLGRHGRGARDPGHRTRARLLALGFSILTLSFAPAAGETADTVVPAASDPASAPAANGNGTAHAQNSDPLEGINRAIFALDMDLDDALFKPSAYVYRWVVPKPGRKGIRNILNNLDSPVIFANDILQGEWSRAGTTTARFGLNSTLGLLGLFDVAKAIGLPRHDEDFGQTLAADGDVGAGPYLVLPILGPTNFRDLTGKVIDLAFDPLTWMGGSNAQTFAISRFVLDAISEREANIETFDEIERTSIDLYSQVRSIYNQHRNAQIKNGRDSTKDLPDLSNLDLE